MTSKFKSASLQEALPKGGLLLTERFRKDAKIRLAELLPMKVYEFTLKFYSIVIHKPGEIVANHNGICSCHSFYFCHNK